MQPLVCAHSHARAENLRGYNRAFTCGKNDMAKLKLDLHDIFNKGKAIDSELNRIMQDACDKRISLVEIIPGKGSGQLKEKVLRFLNQKHIKQMYHRLDVDNKNFGRIFVHFRHNRDE